MVFFRSAFALIPLVIFLWIRKEFPHGLSTKRPGAHFLRSSFGVVSLFRSFAVISQLDLAEAILVAQLSPIILAVAAVVLLAERLTVWRVGGLVFGFAGVVVLVWPEVNGGSTEKARLIGFGVALLSAVLSALSLIMVRSLNKNESPGAIALYFVLASMIEALFTIPWGWIVPDNTQIIFLVGAGLFGGFAHIAMTMAFRYAEASRLAPIEYVALLWIILADIVLFQTALTSAFAMPVPIILSGALIAASEGSARSRR